MSSEQFYLWEGIEQKASESQWYTNPRLAQRIVEWTLAAYPNIKTVLEPSAGEGALVKPFLRLSETIGVLAVERDPDNVLKLEKLGDRVEVVPGDFLNALLPRVDIVVMNPPYENDQDCDFVMRAFESASVVVALLRGVIKHGVNRWKKLWMHADIVREVALVERWSFGGEHSPMQDFCVLELRKRETKRGRGEPVPVASLEWW